MLHDPLFTTVILIPEELDISLQEWHDMPLLDFTRNVGLLRKHIINNVLNQGHDFFSGNFTLEQINGTLQRLNSEGNVTFRERPILSYHAKQPEYWSGLIAYNSQMTRGLNCWFPERARAKGSGGFSITDQFYDEKQFYTNVHAIIKKDRFKFLDNNSKRSLSKIIRSGLRLVNGNQPINNFPANLAKWIYCKAAQKHGELNDFWIYDQSMGYAGRLGGALAAANSDHLQNTRIHYYGTDVHKAINERYEMIRSYWEEYINPNLDFDLYASVTPAESIFDDIKFAELKGCFDMSFTSPPYFNRENYSVDPEQSCHRYDTYDDGTINSWKYGFLQRMIQNTYELLKDGGEMWINIADLKRQTGASPKYLPLQKDTIDLARKAGFTFKRRYKILMAMHHNPEKSGGELSYNHIRVKGKLHKYEPLYVFIT
ncbi:MAG: hypothetical protein PF588_00265 [Candidatus Kapabacteria bacterium]|jgi:hypothetical protein|nr:hypothetical protein [Candidatus Kapabacteria bacterium]